MNITEKIDKYLNEESNSVKIENQLKKIMKENNIEFSEIESLSPTAGYSIKLKQIDKDFEKLKKILLKYETVLDIKRTKTIVFVSIANVSMRKGILY